MQRHVVQVNYNTYIGSVDVVGPSRKHVYVKQLCCCDDDDDDNYMSEWYDLSGSCKKKNDNNNIVWPERKKEKNSKSVCHVVLRVKNGWRIKW